jgi:hypothetical protein
MTPLSKQDTVSILPALVMVVITVALGKTRQKKYKSQSFGIYQKKFLMPLKYFGGKQGYRLDNR